MSKDFYSDDHTIQTGAPGSGNGNLNLEGEDSIVIIGNRTESTRGVIEITDSITLKGGNTLSGDSYGQVRVQGADLIVGLGSPSPVVLDEGCDLTVYGTLANYTVNGNPKVHTENGFIEINATNGSVTIDTPDTNITGDVEIDGDLIVNGTISQSGGLSNAGDINISATNGGDINLSATGLSMPLGSADINITSSNDINLNSSDLNITADNIVVLANNPGSGPAFTEAAMMIANTYNSDNSDVLYLKNFYSGSSGSGNNFIAFFDGASGGNDIGSIEGDGSGGISVHSPGADYGEWMPIGDRLEWPEYSGEKNILGIPEGTLVWVKDSKIWRHKGSTPMIVTNRAIVCGNKPKNSFHKPTNEAGEILSFIGQVPTFVEGTVEDGDLLVPVEGTNHCMAINPDQISFQDYRKAVGTAWGKKLTSEVARINCAIGIK